MIKGFFERLHRLFLGAALLFYGAEEARPQSPVAVTLLSTTSPTVGEPGVTNVSVTGSNFPTGTIPAANVTVTLTPASGPAVNTLATAVAAVAGTTRRVSFTIPASVSVPAPAPYMVTITGTTSTGTAFQSSNSASLTVNPAASISTVAPNSGPAGQSLSVAVTGQYSNFLQGSTVANFGAGITATSTQVTNATHATVNISIAGSATASPRTVSMTTGVEVATLTNGFSVTSVSGPPAITDFNPKSASVGAIITVTGTNLQPNAGSAAQFTLSKQGSGTIVGFAATATPTSLTFVIPAGAATGVPSVIVNGQSANGTVPLTIVPSSTFTLTAMPGTANVIRGQSAAYAVSLATSTGFNQLAALSVTGLPTGVTASFQPQQITVGQNSVLSVTAPAGQSTGSSPLTVTASANVNGLTVTQSANVTLSVQAVTTTLLGRTVVSDSPETPLAGVTIKMLGLDGNGNTTGCTGTTSSDGAGNFALTNLPAVCVGPQLVGYDGTTVTAPTGKYAGVNLIYTLVSGQVTPAPVLIHLPRIDNQETFLVQQNAAVDQSYAYQTIPNLSVTVYAGTTFTMPDGTIPNPFPLTVINVPPDRLPDIKPPVPTMITAFIVAFQPANATTNQPVAVYYPNALNTPPGADMALLTLDPTHGAMVPYGTGAVSADGTQIVPDLDPAHPGHRYGLVHFDWHMPGYPPANQLNPCAFCPIAKSGDPVDLSSGLEVINETDFSFGGSRGTVSLVRTYRNAVSTSPPNYGPFGFGTNHNFGYELGVVTAGSASVIPLIMPDGNQFPFSKQSNGTYVNSSGIPSMAGAVMTVVSGSEVDLRWKDGTIFKFNQVTNPPIIRNLLGAITDPNGNTIQLLRDGFQITDIIDPVGRDLNLSYNGDGFITQLTAPDGRVVSYNYGSGGIFSNNDLLRVVTHPDGTTTRYDYDNAGNLTAITDGRGVVVASNTYGANNRITQQRQANGGVLQFGFSLQNPTAPATSPVMSATVIDALGNVTTYRFSPAGALLSATDALGRLRTFARDGNNNITSITGAATCSACGDSTAGDQTFSYDGVGNLLSQTDALGNTTSFTYDPVFNKVTSVKDPLGNITTFTYDSHGNLLTQMDADHNTTSYQYNSFGELTAATDALSGTTHFSYDTLGNLVSVQDPLSNTTTFQYDYSGRLLVTQDALGRRTTLAYDNANRIISQTNAQNGATLFAYDQVGNLLSVKDARNNITSFTYDAMNGLLTRKDPLSRIDTRTYDLDENLTAFQDRRGQSSSFTYDVVNRLTDETYQDSTVARSYDANDRLIVANDSAGGNFTFSYDLAGRLTGSQSPFGAIQYTRDPLGRAGTRQVAGQAAVTYTYDPAGNLSEASLPQAAVDFSYNVRNQVSKVSRMNGVSSAFSYDSVARLLTIAHAKGTSVIDTESYGYDAAGNRTSHSTSIGQSLITPAVATASYDGDNEQTQFGTTANVFDASGNSRSTASSGGTSTYVWDSRGRLKSVTTSAGQMTSFIYDFAGNLIQQIDSGTSLNLTQTLVLDDLTNVAYVNRSDGDQYSVLAGQSIDDHFAVAHGNGQIEYGLIDGINSTVATTDQTGATKGQFKYEPFGLTTATNSTYPFQFTGRVPVSSSLYYFRARFYNAQTGRFISEDPIGFGGGDANFYRYVGNAPTGFTDPAGLVISQPFHHWPNPSQPTDVGPVCGILTSEVCIGVGAGVTFLGGGPVLGGIAGVGCGVGSYFLCQAASNAPVNGAELGCVVGTSFGPAGAMLGPLCPAVPIALQGLQSCQGSSNPVLDCPTDVCRR